MINRLAGEILIDEYFNILLNKAEKINASKFLKIESDDSLTSKEYIDLLKFADILSNSNHPNARNKSYYIICLLFEQFKANPKFKTVSSAVFSKVGNFPALRYLAKNYNYVVELPFERELEKELKNKVQAVPGTKDLVFTDSQFKLFSQIKDSNFFSFSGPTSMGKSFIIKSFIRYIINNNTNKSCNIAIIVPTRALLNQFSVDLNKELEGILSKKKFKVLTNSNAFEYLSSNLTNYLFVLTPERLLSYLSQPNNPSLQYLFIDEAHKLASGDYRSITYYKSIEETLKKFKDIKIYFASPNVSNPGVFLWIFNKNKDHTFHTSENPVAQNLYFIDLLERKINLFANSVITLDSPIIKNSKSVLDIIFNLGSDQQNIIYCNGSNNAINYSLDFAHKYNKPDLEINKESNKDLIKLIKMVKQLIHKDYFLVECLNKRVAFHFGNLPQIIRLRIEDLFQKGSIDYIFCTSTLLEGVNLPAKNVFILTDKIGSNLKFKKIDFWNLAGRAGRLTRELSGNIICVRDTDKAWKDISILKGKEEIILNTPIIDQTNKEIIKIEGILKDTKKEIKPLYLKEILEYIANIICIDTLNNNYQSPIIKGIDEANRKEIINAANGVVENIEIPSNIIDFNPSIGIKYQNTVYKYLNNNKYDRVLITFPVNVDYDSCLRLLNTFYNLYSWRDTEKNVNSTKNLKYFAYLMTQWINGFSLNQIINSSIDYYQANSKSIEIYINKKREIQIFDETSKIHINTLINLVINNIEKVLRYTLEKYCNNYYIMLVSILGEEGAGNNWATFLEYGTRNPTIIALQNLGFSRHISDYLLKNHTDCLIISEKKLVGINKEKLLPRISKESIEYDEIISLI